VRTVTAVLHDEKDEDEDEDEDEGEDDFLF